MSTKTHIVKCLEQYYKEVVRGSKTFEVRKNNRNYQSGDIVTLCETRMHKDGMSYLTGNSSRYIIGYVLKDFPALQPGQVVFSITPCP